MPTDKEVKVQFKKTFSASPEKYYPVKYLKELGFKRSQCKKCKKFYWSIEDRSVCGDASCIGKYEFLSKKITNVNLSYSQVWEKFSKLFVKLGYKSLKRYPVVARWRDDTLYVKASIYDFQPHVTSGNIPPPAEKLVVPQPCLRFNDIENVGVTMSHMTNFVMIGQHAFQDKKKFSQIQVFTDICTWLFDELKLPLNEVIFHEDAWAGGGNFGPCMEFFAGGLELGNQVYMMYEMTEDGIKDLELKVLDMGMGMERVAWFTQQAPTIYDATFPETFKKVLKASSEKLDFSILKKYVPFGALLNQDEIDDLDKNLGLIAKSIGVSKTNLTQLLEKISALYSITEHARSLLFAIADGSLPSNVGDAYNLRILLRRTLSFINKYKWNIDLLKVVEWHAQELKSVFPDLILSINDVKKVISVEIEKYISFKLDTHKLIKTLKKENLKLSTKSLIDLYDSKGINPQDLKEAGLDIKIPQNFYSLVADKHNTKVKSKIKKNLIKIKANPTTLSFYENEDLDFEAKIKDIIKTNTETIIVLDKTNFYPKSGGQDYDTGLINNLEVKRVQKQGDHILHFINDKTTLKINQEVKCKINKERRLQLTTHHTATHIVNAAAKKVLGNHIYQAGANKTIEKSRLDITHFSPLKTKEVLDIQKEANNIIKQNLKITKSLMPRNIAENKYGFSIYQGGYVPGKQLRIVEIKGLDVEACGGTHLNNTKDAIKIKMIKTSKIHDGIIRLEFMAGKAAIDYENKIKNSVGKDISSNLEEISKLFRVQKDKVKFTIDRFNNELLKNYAYLTKIAKHLGKKKISFKMIKVTNVNSAKVLFKLWRDSQKQILVEELNLVKKLSTEIKEKSIINLNFQPGVLIKIANNFKQILLYSNSGFYVFKGKESDFNKLRNLGAKGGGKDVKQGKIELKKIKEFNF